MCRILSASKVSPTPATEEVTFNKREERKVSGVSTFKCRVYTVRALFDRPPCPAMMLEAQEKAGLPVSRFAVYPETAVAKTAGGVTEVVWKVRA